MIKRKIILILIVCLVSLVFSGCRKEPGVGATGSDIWEEFPALTYGVMEYEKLEALPWNSGRCEATSFYTMAETENGIYMLDEGFQKLFFADKTDLTNWVMVCNQPECEHWQSVNCNATMHSRSFFIRGERIFYEQLTGSYDLYQSKAMGKIIASMAQDGTDRKLEFVLEDALLSTAGTSHTLLTPQHWLYSTCSLSMDGSMKTRFFRVTQDGTEEYPIEQSLNNTNTGIYWIGKQYYLYGDAYFDIALLDNDGLPSAAKAYRFNGDEIATLDMALLFKKGQYAGGYVSDDVLRTFRVNEGYYDQRIQTGETVQLAAARLENGGAFMVLPNCVIETTLHPIATSFHTEGIKHGMEFFDGQTWKTVSLPPELVSAGQNDYLSVMTVTSDSIIFRLHKDGDIGKTIQLYGMSIESDTPELVKLLTLTYGQ